MPDASLEANAIAARFQEVTLLIGKEATLNAVQKNLPKSNIFHFAGHAYATVDGPLLLLAGSTLHERGGRAFLSADHLGAMRLRQCKLVVLSACETGQSRDVGLADPESLVRTFLGVGVGNVVASRWKVESAATGAFMDSFYSALLSGQRVSVALETAALNIRRKPGMAHPYYWAAFESYGRM